LIKKLIFFKFIYGNIAGKSAGLTLQKENLSIPYFFVFPLHYIVRLKLELSSQQRNSCNFHQPLKKIQRKKTMKKTRKIKKLQ